MVSASSDNSDELGLRINSQEQLICSFAHAEQIYEYLQPEYENIESDSSYGEQDDYKFIDLYGVLDTCVKRRM